MLSRQQGLRRRPLLSGPSGAGPDPELEQLVRKALEEWQAAQAHFDAVAGASDPDLVDHAIYHLEAARRKYMYLLKQVQKARGLPVVSGIPAGAQGPDVMDLPATPEEGAG
ncbi:YaaL family protein [Caldinitratiruptor microaerophilus]|uniref:DUF2508 domain-containing protein n=1 Tax=Caldinitratiruptor microaerophilus TaxID=671077 RepID=A0AA35CQI3_9FIRM|nr:YaaL family protein [Caldinitratiruptor microaerophilus]BDG61960.1 hypothetical protein caldi_30500 [Caldinitratiruptor microaerophilus]